MPITRSRVLAGVAAASALALGVAGCGDGGGATTVTETAPATQATATSPAEATTDTTPTTLTQAPETEATQATSATADTSATVDTTALTDIARYLEDVQAASNSLTTFGTALQAVNNPRQLEARYDSLTAELDTFDEAIARMEGYTLSQSEIEAQRQRLVAAGPPLSDVLRRFLDSAQQAIDTNNPAPLQAILPEVARQIQNFTQAAQGGTSTTP